MAVVNRLAAPPPAPPGAPKAPPPPTNGTPAPAAAMTRKTFSVSAWSGEKEGEKTGIYGRSGMGKTSLAALLPNPIFIGLDDGARRIRNPKTGEPINAILGVETYADLRDVFHQTDLFKAGSTCVIDTATRMEQLAEAHVIATVPVNDKGKKATSIKSYGYGDGYKHLQDAMRLLLADMETLVRNGVNIALLMQQAQATVANLEGIDYLEDGPKLSNDKRYSVRSDYYEWCDHVLRIGYSDVSVSVNDMGQKVGRASGTTKRAVYTAGELHFIAKNRVMPHGTCPQVVPFDSPDDDSIWRLIFKK